MLNAALASLGLASGSGKTVTAVTEKGIEQLAQKLGAPKSVTFDPNWFVFLPVPSLVVESIDLQLAAPAPTAGSAIITGRASLLTARLVEPSTQPESTTSYADSSVSSASETGEPPTTNTAPQITATEGSVVTVGTTTLQIAADRQTIAPESLAALEAAISLQANQVEAQLTTPPQPNQFLTSPSSIVTDAEGRTCVIVGRGSDAHPVNVDVVGGSYSLSIVTGDLVAGDEVALNPPGSLRKCAQ